VKEDLEFYSVMRSVRAMSMLIFVSW
jgi:hypothetical protein